MRLALLALVLAFPMQANADAMPICGAAKRITCVVDGDTFRLRGVKYRIANIDAPEVEHYRCPAELALGRQATARLADLLGAGRFNISNVGTDRYGRTLTIVSRDGRSIGPQLVREGLAHRWEGGKRSWC